MRYDYLTVGEGTEPLYHTRITMLYNFMLNVVNAV